MIAGSWAPACTAAPERIGALPSRDAHGRGHRDRQPAGRAGARLDASALAALATGSRSMDPASDQTDGSAAATLPLPEGCRLGGAGRHRPHAAHLDAVARPFRSIRVLSSSAGDAPKITRPPQPTSLPLPAPALPAEGRLSGSPVGLRGPPGLAMGRWEFWHPSGAVDGLAYGRGRDGRRGAEPARQGCRTSTCCSAPCACPSPNVSAQPCEHEGPRGRRAVS